MHSTSYLLTQFRAVRPIYPECCVLTFPGLSLHEELALFVDAGLTPFEALKTATINAARALRIERDYGAIEPGNVADIVIPSANPSAVSRQAGEASEMITV